MIRLEEVPITVQRRWLAALRETWCQINRTDLQGRLREPLFVLDDAATRLGRYEATTRTLGVSVDHIVAAPIWRDVERTVRHEMAHQVVIELFGATGTAAHGEAFRRACRLLRIDDEGAVGAARTPEELRVLDKIRKLLALAGSPNQHEAEVAMATASRLLLRHNLSLADTTTPHDYAARTLGGPTARVGLDLKLVATILQEHFFVSCIWLASFAPISGKSAKMLEIMGRPHNLELAAYAHDFLLATVDRLWESYRATLPIGRAGQATRNAYRAGVLLGFREHLDGQRTSHREEGLVWVGDPGLGDFFARRYPRTRTLGASTYRPGEAHEHGRADGRKVRIRPGIGGAPATSRGRLLGPG